MASEDNAQPSASDMRNAEAGAAKGAAPGNVSETCESCIAADCKSRIEEIEKETKRISDIKDPIARNKMITAAYQKLYNQDPSNRWLKLGGIVSSQVGCNLQMIQGIRDGYYPSFKDSLDSKTGLSFSKNMLSALGEGNKAIFRDIYPLAAYRARHGYEDLKKCYSALGKDVPDQMQRAFEELEKGKWRPSADLIGDYEQKRIIDDIYKDYSGTFFTAEHLAAPIWEAMYHQKPYEIPVSSTCGDSDVVKFPGSISNSDDRVEYYKQLMNRLSFQQGW